MFWVVESFRSFGPAAIVGWAVGLTAGSVVLTYLYRGSGNSILLVAAWHTAFKPDVGHQGNQRSGGRDIKHRRDDRGNRDRRHLADK